MIAWSLHSEALYCLILWEFKGQNIAMPAKYVRKCVDRLILVTQNSSWSLDWLLKRTLITWFHFDPGCKHFYKQRLCDYPLNVGTCPNLSSPCKSCLKYSHGERATVVCKSPVSKSAVVIQHWPIRTKVSLGISEYRVIPKILLLLRRCKQLHSSIAHAGRSS